MTETGRPGDPATSAAATPDDAVQQLSTLLDQLTGSPEPEPPAAAGPAAAGPAATAEPAFRDLESFLQHYLAPVVERRLMAGAASGISWCPEWWRHPEGISRLYALWRSWESLRVSDPALGMSLWWRDHLDPHLQALTGELGAFHKCSPDRGHVDNPASPLPLAPAPAEVLAQLPDYEP